MNAQNTNLLFFVVLMAMLYFVVVRPQRKRAQEQKAMLAALVPDDEVVTVGGMFATVVEIGERVRLRLADGSELEVVPGAIARKVTE